MARSSNSPESVSVMLRSTLISRHALAALGMAITTLAVGGCSPGVPVVPVQGTVTWKGAPLTRGTVVFQPYQIEAGLPRRPATGHLQKDGTFRLTTFEPGDGAVVGTYQVTVHSYSSEPSDMGSDTDIVDYVWAIPSRYGDPSRSGLTAEVPAGERLVELDFELTE